MNRRMLERAISAAISKSLQPPANCSDLTDWRYIRAYWYASRAQCRMQGLSLEACNRGIESASKWIRYYGGEI